MEVSLSIGRLQYRGLTVVLIIKISYKISDQRDNIFRAGYLNSRTKTKYPSDKLRTYCNFHYCLEMVIVNLPDRNVLAEAVDYDSHHIVDASDGDMGFISGVHAE